MVDLKVVAEFRPNWPGSERNSDLNYTDYHIQHVAALLTRLIGHSTEAVLNCLAHTLSTQLHSAHNYPVYTCLPAQVWPPCSQSHPTVAGYLLDHPAHMARDFLTRLIAVAPAETNQRLMLLSWVAVPGFP